MGGLPGVYGEPGPGLNLPSTEHTMSHRRARALLVSLQASPTTSLGGKLLLSPLYRE